MNLTNSFYKLSAKRLFASLLVLVIGSSVANAQDIHFAQSAQVPVLINPANAGLFNGWERIILNHRAQWNSVSSPYVTTNGSLEMNLGKPDVPGNAYVGLGLNFYTDKAGDAKFGTTKTSLNVSAIVPVHDHHTVAAGIQFGGGQKSVNLDQLTWASQFDGSTGTFDNTIGVGEPIGIASNFFFDMGMGAVYEYKNHNVGFGAGEILRKGHFGLSMFHLTKPKLNFGGSVERLDRKFVIHGDVMVNIPGSKISIEPNMVIFKQGIFTEQLYGALVKIAVKSGTKYTGIYTESFFSLGAKMRVGDAIIPEVFLELDAFKVGISYDLNLSFSEASRYMGGFEISFQWANLNTALFKRRGSKGFKKPGLGA
jgi:type IX secretion system PorP/SprF family membrane protein